MQPHRKRPARRKVVKKAARPAGGTAAGGRVPPRSRNGYQSRSDPSGGGGGIVTVFIGIVAVALALIALMIMLPTNLDDKIDGYSATPLPVEKETAGRNWLPDLQDTILNPQSKVEMTEEELNRYIAQRLRGTQTGTFGGLVRYSGTYIDLKPGVAEVYIERKMFGRPLTMSVEVKREETANGRETWKIGGGSIGKLRMGEFSFGPVIKPFLRMARTAVHDMDVMKKVRNIEFSDGKMILGATS